MKIQNITEDNLDLICAICLDPSVDREARDFMDKGMDNRLFWIKRMMPKGLGILVASEAPRHEKIHYKWVGKMLHSDLAVQGQVPMGLLEYIPIEHALEPVQGKNCLFINCMWVLPPFWYKGVGKKLIESFIEKAKQYGAASVISYEEERWFGTSIKYMPSSFFKKYGFKEIDRDGSRILQFLDLGSSVQPKFIFPKNKSYIDNMNINLDIFFNNQCPWSKYMITTIKRGIEKYPNINLNMINTNERREIKRLGISRGICLNQKLIFNRMVSWKEIEPVIEKFVKKSIDKFQ
ncbi:MAG: GNAT family N-acetyltransferase [Promethearchaeota archaeon]